VKLIITLNEPLFLVQKAVSGASSPTLTTEEFIGVCTKEDLQAYGTDVSDTDPYRVSTFTGFFPSSTKANAFRTQVHLELTEYAGLSETWEWDSEEVEEVTLTDTGDVSGPFMFTQEV
jgi:hypothetical protein